MTPGDRGRRTCSAGECSSRRDRLAESDGSGEDGPQKAFRITSDGGRELAAWLRTHPDLSSPRDELVMKVLIALRVPGADPHEVIQAHRAEPRVQSLVISAEATAGTTRGRSR